MPATTPRRRRVLKWIAGLGLSFGAFCLVTVLLLNAFAGPAVRGRLVRFLEARYHADVQIEKITIKLLPQLHVDAEHVAVRRRDQPASFPPFFSIKRLNLYGGLAGLLRDSPHLARIDLEGFEINIPPKRQDNASAESQQGQDAAGNKAEQGQNPQDSQHQNSQNSDSGIPDVIVRQITANGTVLRIYSSKPGKNPLQFTIRRLKLKSVGINQPMEFAASLENATPPGLIDSQGHFGPWDADDPGKTSVSGHYKFRNANLAVFRGISGILSSDGDYWGKLERLEVNGWTDTPDFAVGISGNRVPLRTDFHAIVDATSGDTRLEPVKVRLPHSTLVATGSVANQPGPEGKPVKGKTITLHVTADGARMEDLLRLAMKSDPPLTGIIHLDTEFVLPPGHRDISEKLSLKGQFALDRARFRHKAVQSKIRKLSLRGRGINQQEENGFRDERVVSNLKGRFVLKNGVMRLPNIYFEVPGAVVHLQGKYGLSNEAMNFTGELRLHAKLSQTTGGIKALLLKPLDPLFHRDGAGALIPIHINGTRKHPDFGVDVGRIFSMGAEHEAKSD